MRMRIYLFRAAAAQSSQQIMPSLHNRLKQTHLLSKRVRDISIGPEIIVAR